MMILICFLIALFPALMLTGMLFRALLNTAFHNNLHYEIQIPKEHPGPFELCENEGFYLVGRITNTSHFPLAGLHVMVTLPDSMFCDGKSMIETVCHLPGCTSEEQKYWITVRQRGIYSIDNITVTRKRFLWMNLAAQRFDIPKTQQNTVTVYPSVIPLEEHFTTSFTFTGENEVKRSIAEDPMDFIGIREYRDDPVSRIHWKKSAAAEELYVKELGFTEEYDVTILLNLQSRAYERYDPVNQGISSRGLTELAVTVAASIIDELSDSETPVTLLTNGTAEDGETIALDEDTCLTAGTTGASVSGSHALMRLLARLDVKVTVPAHEMLEKIAGDPEMILTGRSLMVVSPYFDGRMRQFYQQMTEQGYSIVFYITSLFTDLAEIPDDIPLYYRTHKGELS